MSRSVVASSLALGLVGCAAGTSQDALIKGVSYGPLPLKSMEGASEVPADDWFCDEAVTMWGDAGRGDLRVISQLGANLVRLYGNNPDHDHTNFLDDARSNGLAVAPGMSDFPFYQMVPGSCRDATDFNCFSQVKPLYSQMLQKGFLTDDRQYHPALKYMNILNEPDLKMPSNADSGGVDVVYQMCRSIISAFDAMLEAEKELGVTGPLINFTATFSFAICASCEMARGSPALSQMAQLDDAMRNPRLYGYEPINDITAAYETRFTHSFNTANPAQDVKSMFLDLYETIFPSIPVYIAEYHRVGANQTEDLGLIMEIAEASSLFLGISFFQYQTAYWKEGSEREFGMFGLGEFEVGSMPYVTKTYPIYCLEPVYSINSGTTIPDALTKAFDGPGVDVDLLCAENPLGVPLDQTGYMQIAAQRRDSQMEIFIQRLIHNLGAVVKPGREADLDSFVRMYSATPQADGFARMAGYLGSRPAWLNFETEAKCVANRGTHPDVIGKAIGWVCEQGDVDCDRIPKDCNSSTYHLGDYIFSHYFNARGDPRDPLVGCNFQGAALFAPSDLYSEWGGAERCATDHEPATTTAAPTTTKDDEEASTSDSEVDPVRPGGTTSSNFLVHSGAPGVSALNVLMAIAALHMMRALS